MDQLINLLEQDSDFTAFNLDGQTLILHDYLDLRPNKRKHLQNLISHNRLQIGPWYVLADEFLVSGEALIRNLLYGHRIAKDFGAIMSIGYVPDTFGHIAQLPQLLKGFNMTSTIFWRGLEDQGKTLPTELLWRAPDGSEVLLVHLRTSYSTAANLPNSVDASLAQLLMPMKVLSLRAMSSAILLMNGSDHLPPQPFLPNLLKKLNQRLQTQDILQGRSVSQLLGDLGKSPITTEVTGIDQISPFLDEVFSDFLQEMQGVKFKQGTLQDYLDIIRQEVDLNQLSRIEGEQHSSKYISILSGVFSSRIYLKQANFATQQLLERWAEPFATIAWWHGAPYPAEGLRRAWEQVLQNHPHDSICGCSVDATHADMERRSAWSQQLGNQILSDAVNYINQLTGSTPSPKVPQPCIATIRIFNPHPWTHTSPVRVLIQPIKPFSDITKIGVYDSEGNRLPAQIIPAIEMDPSFLPLLELHSLPRGFVGEPEGGGLEGRLVVTVLVEVVGLGVETLFVAEGASMMAGDVVGGVTVIEEAGLMVVENKRVRVEVGCENGVVGVVDKGTGQRYSSVLVFEDGGDRGDEYTYCPPELDDVISSQEVSDCEVRVVEAGPVAVTLKARLRLQIPQGLEASRRRRAAQLVELPVENLITIYAQSPRVDVQTNVSNRVLDHRLRVLFPTHLATDTAWGDTPFYVIERPLTPASQDWEAPLYPMMIDYYMTSILKQPNVPGKHMGWFEDSTTTHALQTFVDVTDDDKGLLIASRGLPEYEVLTDTKRTIALTLLRCVGWLSRNDLTTRRGHAGPEIATPGAQCLGDHTFHYSIIPHQGTWQHPTVRTQVQTFVVPLKAMQLFTTEENSLPPKHSFLDLTPSNVAFSILKKAEASENAILRIYELHGEPTTTHLSFGFSPTLNVTEATLDEKPFKQSLVKSAGSNTFTIPTAPYQIQTLKVTPKES